MQRWFFLFFVTCALFWVGLDLSAADWEGKPVLDIRHQPEDPLELKLDSADLEQIIEQKTGQPYSAGRIGESIESLYATGRFADIAVDAQEENEGVVLTFLTEGNYFVGSVAVQGVTAPPNEGQLVGATRFQLGRLFLEEDQEAAIQGLRRVLEDNGYFQAEIVPHYEKHPATQQVNITFAIRAETRARLGGVQVTGQPVFSPEQLLDQARWNRGKPFTAKLVQDGLARLQEMYREQDYLEAEVSVTEKIFREPSHEVDLELNAVAGAQVEVSLTGASLGRSRIVELLPIFEEGVLDEDLLEEGERNLENYFQSEGYFQAQVRYRRQSARPERSVIEYQVELGPRQSLQEIQIVGNQYFSTATLRERMRIEPARFFSRRGRFSSRLLEADLNEIRSLYLTNGFQQIEVRASLQPPAATSENDVVVVVQVREGTQTRIGQFALTGNESFSADRLSLYINAGSGQPYSESLVDSDRDNLLTYYFNEGFPEARFEARTKPAQETDHMDLEYVLEEGQREYVGHIFVEGLRNTRRGVVNRQLQLRSATPLSQGDLLETQRRLFNLGVFSQVEMRLQNPAGRERERNVLVYLREAPRYTLRIGLGGEFGRFGDTGQDRSDVEGDNEFSPNGSFDLTRLNMGGRPHTASLRMRFSSLQKRAGLAYTAPRFLNYEWLHGSASLFFEETRDVRTFTARRLEGTIQFESKRSRATTWVHRYSFRRVAVDTSTLQVAPDQIPIVSRPVLVGMLSQTWIRDTRDVPADAQQGRFATADVGLAASPLGSRTSFFRMLVQHASYHRLGGGIVLARTLQFGMQEPFGGGRRVRLLPVEEGAPPQEIFTNEIPIAERFFAGGGSSHRGFAVNQAGPRDLTTGFALGGNTILLNTLEMRFPVWGESLRGVLFHDAGNVFAGIGDLSLRQHQHDLSNFSYISHAVGLGLRYRTPVGPVRFDLGYNLNPPRFRIQTVDTLATQTLSRWQVLFSIGQSF
ncbi:MAG: outer membrane protein assembly factor BamA [Acidobacteria bacterium]|nr:outer membrane protein assembly factor BamA [Acidobacteriota bacterium]